MIKVFLVDDEIVIREGIRSSFPWEKTEYTLIGEAPDGEMALQMIRDTRPDILITDIRMPFMNGIELSRIVRREMPWISIVILSGYDEFEYARQAISLGVREYILKPVTAEELKNALDRVCETLRREAEERERNERIKNRMDSASRFVREKLLRTLYSEDTREEEFPGVVSQLGSMGIMLDAPFYQVVDAAFEPVTEGYNALMELAESSGNKVFVSGCRTGGRAVVLGQNETDTEERAYAFAAALCTELERNGCGKIRISIGEMVDCPEKIPKSLQRARHIRHALTDEAGETPRIVGVREFGETGGETSGKVMTAKARMYLSEHFMNSGLMLQDVAGAVGMSNSRFSTVFAQECGKTFTEYLTNLRLEKAKLELKNTEKRGSQIALEVGYNDAHYFSYLFKKNEGMTPGEYRQKVREEKTE